MLIAIMIGNSSVRLGLFKGGALHTARFDSKIEHDYAGHLRAFMAGHATAGARVVIGSVVPALSGIVADAAREVMGHEPMVVDHTHAEGIIKLDIDNPETLGVDRMAVAVAAWAGCGAPVAAVDFGTATTVNFVSDGPVFRGGAIMPGLGLMAGAMQSGTAKLPPLELRNINAALGRNTGSAMLSGIIFGSAGAVRRIVDEVGRSTAMEFKALVVTGGYAPLVLPHTGGEFDEWLALKGLKIICEGHTHA